MGSDKTYRWEKRRDKKSRHYKSFHIDILDWVMLALLFIMVFISLRLFFIFEVTSAPCAEHIITAGQSSGLPPIFEMAYAICILMGTFWLCVTIGRILAKRTHWALIAWHIIIFVSIFFLAAMNRNLTSSDYVNPPDGVMVVEQMVPVKTNQGVSWLASEEVNWAYNKDGQWYAWGTQACIWLDENKVSHNNILVTRLNPPLIRERILGRPAIEDIKNLQIYRTLQDHERERFMKIKACQADMSLYGKPRSTCNEARIYPVEDNIRPPQHVIEMKPFH